jgi:hypothetical protein
VQKKCTIFKGHHGKYGSIRAICTIYSFLLTPALVFCSLHLLLFPYSTIQYSTPHLHVIMSRSDPLIALIGLMACNEGFN